MSAHQLPRVADPGPLRNPAKDSIHKELRHRGELLVAYPGAELWKAVGGSDGVVALVEDLYRRIEQDELLRVAFAILVVGLFYAWKKKALNWY